MRPRTNNAVLFFVALVETLAVVLASGCGGPNRDQVEHIDHGEPLPRRHPDPTEWRWRPPEETRSQHVSESQALIRD